MRVKQKPYWKKVKFLIITPDLNILLGYNIKYSINSYY